MESLTINGTTIISEDPTLMVTKQIQISKGAKFVVLSTIFTSDFRQFNDVYLKNGDITVIGKCTIGGATKLYIQNSAIHVNEMIINGNIQHPEYNPTKNHSIIESIDTKYLNRVKGSVICRPVLFTTKNDQATSGINISDVRAEIDESEWYHPGVITSYFSNSFYNSFYNLSDEYYQYQDHCIPLTTFPVY